MKYLISNNLELFNTTNTSVEEAINKLKELDEVCVDSETTGLDAHLDKLVLLQLGNKEDQYIFDIVSFNFIIIDSLKSYLNESKQLFIFQNAKFDLKFLLKNNIVITRVYDTLLAETILTNGLQYGGRGLSDLCKKYLGFELDKTLQKKITVNITSDVVEYAAKDIMVLSEIKRRQLIEIENLELNKALELDNNFVPVLAYVEFCGLKLDVDKWKEIDLRNRSIYKECKNSLEDILIKDKKLKYFSGMYDMFDNTLACEINWNSPKQVIEVFDSYGIKTTKIEKGKKVSSIEADILEPQKNDFYIITPYLKLKEVKKKISTYGLNWIDIINPSTGRIHTMFKQLMVTGRLSSGDKDTKSPNFQNIPSDKETRSCFICEKGNKLIAADYSSKKNKYHIFK